MTYEEYRAAALDVAYLASCAVKGIAPDAARAAAMELPAVFWAARRHMLDGVAAMALSDAGVMDEEVSCAMGNAIRRAAIFDMECAAILKKLEEAGIWYAPLKGVVIEALYPALGMRQMVDIDILFDAERADDARAVMESLGFTTEYFGRGIHDNYKKEPVCKVELHRALFSVKYEARLVKYYRDVKARLLPDGESRFGFRFSDEDEYIYLIAHEYKHYTGGGTGLRSLLDIYVYCRSKGAGLDWAYIRSELDKLGVTDFEAQSRRLALNLFNGEPLAEEDEAMLDYILSSGVFGTEENLIENHLEARGRVGFLIYRAFIPRELLRDLYPILDRHPALLPFCEVHRWVKALLSKPKRVLRELKAAIKNTRDRGG